MPGVGTGGLYGVRLAPEFFLVRCTDDLRKGELAQPCGSERDCEPGDVLPDPFSSSFSPKTVLADLASDALLGVLMLPAGLNLATLKDFWSAEPIFSTLLPSGVAIIVEREEMRGRAFFFLTSGSVSISKLGERCLNLGFTLARHD